MADDGYHAAMPTLVLLPGLHGTAHLFEPLRAHLPAEFTVRTISYPTRRLRSPRQLLQQIEAELANETEVVLLGESFSGPLALAFAAAHPQRVRGVILAATFIKAPVPRLLSLLGAPFALVRFPMPGFLMRWFLAGRGASRELVGEMQRVINLNSPLVIAHRVGATAWIDAGAALRRCSVPVLCLAGRHDRLIGRRAVRRMRRCRPGMRVKEFDAPHLLLQRQAEGCAREIAGFVRALETSAFVL